MRQKIAIAAGFFAAIALAVGAPSQAQDDATLPQISLEQKTSLRCAAAFAIVADGQARGNAEALGWPPLGERGREFFVRVSARLMDDAGLERSQVAAMLQREAQTLWNEGQTQAIMPSCMLLLETSGI